MSSSSSADPQQFIEHVVLFKLKDDADPSKVNEWLRGLNGLASLDQVLHLTAGPVLCSRSSGLFSFTHMLHCRYSSEDNLAAYAAHPNHIHVVRELGLPICEDIMAVDWVARGSPGSVAVPPGSAIEISLLKLKEDLGETLKDEVLRAIGMGIKEGRGTVAQQLTCGENFSPARAKGFSVASLTVFKGATKMEAESAEDPLESRREKFRDYLDNIVVVNYVVPS